MSSLKLNDNTIYKELDLIDILKKENPSISDTKIKWSLFELEKNNIITRIGTKTYITNGKTYSYTPSSSTNEINSFLNQKYPLIKYIVWETRQLNEWMNFLFAKNIIIVEVESELKDYVFQSLLENFEHKYMFLLEPDNDQISKYVTNDLVIVKTLFSRSPINKKAHSMTPEKLLVDIISDKTIYSMIGTYDKKEIIMGIINNYTINESKLLTYAKRRKHEKEILSILEARNDK